VLSNKKSYLFFIENIQVNIILSPPSPNHRDEFEVKFRAVSPMLSDFRDIPKRFKNKFQSELMGLFLQKTLYFSIIKSEKQDGLWWMDFNN